jgi:hypothetical protein
MASPEPSAPEPHGTAGADAQSTETASIATLVKHHWYDAAVAVLDRSLAARTESELPPELVAARRLAVAARRVLDLDAQDFAGIARESNAPWSGRLAGASFPHEPHDGERGALGSLVALYELMLEVISLRAAREEPMQVVVTAHMMAEFLAQLAWESTLGHAGDPLRLGDFVGGSRWGTDDPECPHTSAARSTAKRALNAVDGDAAGFKAYLERFHSRQGDALSVCALHHETAEHGTRPEVGESCPNPCYFMTNQPLDHRRDLDARVRLALLYLNSPIVALRHRAPVGHFFAVPSTREVAVAWAHTWEKVNAPWPDGDNPLSADDTTLPASGEEALPGMAMLVSAVAGRPISAGRVIRDIGADIQRALAGAPQAEDDR